MMDNVPDPVFRALSKPHQGVKATTISTWITQCIIQAGYPVPAGQTLGHSTRGKAASKADYAGFSIQQIMTAQDWKTESVYTTPTMEKLSLMY